jgi:hypothetical protein
MAATVYPSSTVCWVAWLAFRFTVVPWVAGGGLPSLLAVLVPLTDSARPR